MEKEGLVYTYSPSGGEQDRMDFQRYVLRTLGMGDFTVYDDRGLTIHSLFSSRNRLIKMILNVTIVDTINTTICLLLGYARCEMLTSQG